MLPNLTIEGRAVNDPELRFTPSGAAVANFRVAASESKKREDGTWEDGDRIFIGVTVWKEAAEQVAESITKGDKVIVTGRLFQREYEGRDGEKRTSLEVKFATVAKVVEAPRGQRSTSPAPPANDPWSAPASNDAPPF